jgi:PAS domain S-box-containing protein
MKTHYYSLLPEPPPPFVCGAPSRHEWLGSHIIILAPDAETVCQLAGDALPRAEGIVLTFGNTIAHRPITSFFYHLTITQRLYPVLQAMADQSGLQGIADLYMDLLGTHARDQTHIAEQEILLLSKNASLAKTRASYDKTVNRLTEMVEDMKRQKDRLSNILEGTHVGTWEWNPRTDEIIINERWAEMLGYAPQELIPLTGAKWIELMHPEDRATDRMQQEMHFRGEADYYACESRRRHKDGRWLWVLNRGKVVARDAQGAPLWMYGTQQDISERKQFEETVSRINEKLTIKNKELEQILYVASHDLRAPLVNIAGFSQELDDAIQSLPGQGVDQEITLDMATSLGFIKKSAEKMDTLLSGLLKLSRLGRAALRIETLRMGALVQRVIAENEFQIRAVGGSVEAQNLPDCLGDEVAMNQVLTNLLSNAIKYRSPQRTPVIKISGDLQEGRAVYRVTDNGMGIAPAHQELVFEIFHRLHNNQCEGEGLGLAIVRQNLGRMGGDVWLESTADQGSTFFVAMPRAEANAEDRQSA